VAADAQPVFIIKEATGEAAIMEGNRDKALQDATNAALREAVEQVAGVMVSSDTLTANSQLISDRILTNSAGYVRKYEILEKKEDRGVMKVTVRAEVGTAELDKDLQAVQALIRRSGSTSHRIGRLLRLSSPTNAASTPAIPATAPISSRALVPLLPQSIGRSGERHGPPPTRPRPSFGRQAQPARRVHRRAILADLEVDLREGVAVVGRAPERSSGGHGLAHRHGDSFDAREDEMIAAA
jgi:hypothetical protein